jgi:hypothetical protein
MSRFFLVSWVVHPDLIPTEVGAVILEPEEPSEVAGADPGQGPRPRSQAKNFFTRESDF